MLGVEQSRHPHIRTFPAGGVLGRMCHAGNDAIQAGLTEELSVARHADRQQPYSAFCLMRPLDGTADRVRGCLSWRAILEEGVQRIPKVVAPNPLRLLPVVINLACIAELATAI